MWRFLQGLLLPPIFAVTVAYIGDEWPSAEIPGVAGIYITGASIGGFCGRFVPGVLADLVGWRSAFLTLAVISLAGAILVALVLPRERGFVRSEGLVRVGTADAAAPAQPAAGRDLCDRLRGAVQFHRDLHVRELPSGGATLQLLADAARRRVRDLPRRLGGRANDRMGDGAIRPAALRPGGDRRLGLRRRCCCSRSRSSPSSRACCCARSAGCSARRYPPAM